MLYWSGEEEIGIGTFKSEVRLEEAVRYLHAIEGGNVTDVAPIDMGEISRVFSFWKDGKAFVIHFKSSREGMDKNKLIHDRYSSQGVPIPRVARIGSVDGGLCYSITEKAPGTAVSSLPTEEQERVVSSLIGHFTAIHGFRTDGTSGIGWIDPSSGDAEYRTWAQFLESLFREDQEGFYANWRELFETSFLERDVFENVYSKMMSLADYSPSERYFVHGDFHTGNMLAEDGKITGIVDWEMAMYGDFMLDVAVMHMWTPHLQFPRRLREAWEAEGRPIPHFEERLQCCRLLKATDALRFYAKKGEKHSYDFIKGMLQAGGHLD